MLLIQQWAILLRQYTSQYNPLHSKVYIDGTVQDDAEFRNKIEFYTMTLKGRGEVYFRVD